MTTIKTYKSGVLNVIKNIDGVDWARCICPDSDISNEPPEVQAACQKAWTPEVIAAYEAHKAAAI